jgi:hypothetical protein
VRDVDATEPSTSDPDPSPAVVSAAPIVVALVIATDWVASHLSLYRLALRLTARDRGRLRLADRLRTRPREAQGRTTVLVAGAPDAAALYIAAWLTVLALMAAFVPRLEPDRAVPVAFAVLCVTVAAWRFLDLVSYQAGILLDPRQRLLRGPERSLALLALNLIELTLVSTIWLYVGAFALGGQMLSRGETLVQSVNVVSLLTPIGSGDAPMVIAQTASHFAAVLLLVMSVGTLLGLISDSFDRSRR